ncbi:MAG: helix-turn-helix domain-containing protein [Pyrinomonadaceae bacterium]
MSAETNSHGKHTRAAASQGAGENIFDDGCLRVEHDNYYAVCAGHSLKLPRAEFLILSRLARNPERIVSSQELWQHVWGDSKPLNAESLHVYIYRLRQKLDPHGVRVGTMVNVGYRLLLRAPNAAADKPPEHLEP